MVVLTSFTQPTDGIRHQQQNTTVYVNNNNLGKGTLYIAESRLSWIGEAGNGFSIEYPHIALHAISRDLSAFPQECLFLMLDTYLGDEDQNDEEDGDADGDDSNKQETTEMRLVPDDRGMLDAMFHAMNACQALHPDPEDSFSDEDFFEDADEESPMEEADSQMARLRIGNMDGRSRTEEGMVGDRVVGNGGGMGGDTVAGTGEGRLHTWGGRGADMEEGRLHILGGREADMEEDISGGRGAGMEEDISGGRGAGMEVGRLHILEGRGAGMEEDISGGMEVGRLHILGGREADMEEDISGGKGAGMEEDISGGRGAGMEAGTEVGLEVGMARDGRSFFLGSTLHRGSTADTPLAHSLHMAHSNFDDAEN